MSRSSATATLSRPEMLRMAAQLNPALSDPSIVMVCGLADDRGIAALAVELGHCFALMRDGPVLVADLCLAAAPRSAFPTIAGRPGMRDVLAGTATLDEVAPATASPGLHLIGAGTMQTLANPLLGPDMAALTQPLKERYRVAFLAVDPLLSSPTGLRLARAVDGIIIGVAAGIDRRDDLTSTIGLFEQMGAKVLGCVLVEG